MTWLLAVLSISDSRLRRSGFHRVRVCAIIAILIPLDPLVAGETGWSHWWRRMQFREYLSRLPPDSGQTQPAIHPATIHLLDVVSRGSVSILSALVRVPFVGQLKTLIDVL